MEVLIKTQWNGKAIDHDPVHFKLEINSDGLVVYVEAPFFNDPSPDGKPGEAMWLLWEYEGTGIVLLYFLCYLVAYLSSYYKKAINAIYELA